MLKLKEICAKAVNKLAHDVVESKTVEQKEKILIKIRETAENGKFECFVDCFHCDNWKEIKLWLVAMGFVVGNTVTGMMALIKWDDISIAGIEMVTEPKPATVTYVEKKSRIEFAWNYDTTEYDFVCSCCNEHSEYTSNYCPNCGAKTYVPNGGEKRNY